MVKSVQLHTLSLFRHFCSESVCRLHCQEWTRPSFLLGKLGTLALFELPALLWGTCFWELKVIYLKCYKGFNQTLSIFPSFLQTTLHPYSNKHMHNGSKMDYVIKKTHTNTLLPPLSPSRSLSLSFSLSITLWLYISLSLSVSFTLSLWLLLSLSLSLTHTHTHAHTLSLFCQALKQKKRKEKTKGQLRKLLCMWCFECVK